MVLAVILRVSREPVFTWEDLGLNWVLELRGGKSVDYPIITVCTGAIGWWQKEVGEGPKYLLWMSERKESEQHRVVRNEKLGSREAKGLFQR